MPLAVFAILTRKLRILRSRTIAHRTHAGHATSDGPGAARHPVVAVEPLPQSDGLSAASALASSVAHELGTSLTVIELRAQMISSGSASITDARRHAKIIVEQTERMTRIIAEMLAASARDAREGGAAHG